MGRNSALANLRTISRVKKARCREHSCPNTRNTGQPWCGAHAEVWQRHHHVKVYKRWS